MPDNPPELLGKLIGAWDLTGRMGETPLHQAVQARWTLGGLFVEVHCQSILDAPPGEKPYEAIYYIGYDSRAQQYVMHLLDTFGVASSRTLGIGRQGNDTIPFVFEYESGPFTNTFTWHPDAEEWTFDLTYLENGAVRTFATKRMRRAEVESASPA